MYIEFSDREYLIEWGKRPKGRGCWWFEFEGYEFQAHGTLTEAKKACRQRIKELSPDGYDGIVIVKILP